MRNLFGSIKEKVRTSLVVNNQESKVNNRHLPPKENRTKLNEKILKSIVNTSLEEKINFQEWSKKH